jgi:MFS transporter, DHA2 family, methylenomycin A resistance protein
MMEKAKRETTLRQGPAHLAGVIVATALGFAVVQLDVSIVNVALATMGKDLGGGVAALQWVVDAYAVAFAALLLTAGALGDRFGARRVFLAGLGIFILASLVCGLARDAGLLIAARVVQGAGAAAILPCSLALLNHACGDDAAARARAISLWTLAGSVALALGPIVGGVLTATVGWRAIFLVNVPLGLLGIWLTLRAVKETRAGTGALDLAGQIFGAAALATLTAGFILTGSNGLTPTTWSCFGAGAIAAACFIFAEARARTPLLPLEFFRKSEFATATLAGFGLNLTLYGSIFTLALYLQRQLHYSAIGVGFALLPFCIALGGANILSGRLTSQRGPRLALVAGAALASAGAVGLLALGATAGYAALLPGLLAFPFGIGLAVPAMTTALLGSVTRAKSGVASGVLNTVRQAGGAIGVAIFGALLAAHGTDGVRASFAGAAVVLAGLAVYVACTIRGQGASAREPRRRRLRPAS